MSTKAIVCYFSVSFSHERFTGWNQRNFSFEVQNLPLSGGEEKVTAKWLKVNTQHFLKKGLDVYFKGNLNKEAFMICSSAW